MGKVDEVIGADNSVQAKLKELAEMLDRERASHLREVEGLKKRIVEMANIKRQWIRPYLVKSDGPLTYASEDGWLYVRLDDHHKVCTEVENRIAAREAAKTTPLRPLPLCESIKAEEKDGVVYSYHINGERMIPHSAIADRDKTIKLLTAENRDLEKRATTAEAEVATVRGKDFIVSVGKDFPTVYRTLTGMRLVSEDAYDLRGRLMGNERDKLQKELATTKADLMAAQSKVLDLEELEAKRVKHFEDAATLCIPMCRAIADWNSVKEKKIAEGGKT